MVVGQLWKSKCSLVLWEDTARQLHFNRTLTRARSHVPNAPLVLSVLGRITHQFLVLLAVTQQLAQPAACSAQLAVSAPPQTPPQVAQLESRNAPPVDGPPRGLPFAHTALQGITAQLAQRLRQELGLLPLGVGS